MRKSSRACPRGAGGSRKISAASPSISPATHRAITPAKPSSSTAAIQSSDNGRSEITMKSSALSKVTIYNAQYVADAPSGHSVLHVRDPHALIRAAGYLKFLARENHQSVYFRGQCQLYDGLSPSLFRGYRTQSAQTKRVNLLRKAIDAAKANNKIFKDFSATAHEPLLQHYG